MKLEGARGDSAGVAASTRRLLLLALPAGLRAIAQETRAADGIRRVVRDASRALQSGSAPLFLAAFDRRAFRDFASFRDQVSALTQQRRIASSVASGVPQSRAGEWTVEVDWLLQLAPKLDPGPVEQRRGTVVLGLREERGRWKIVRAEPRAFFASVRPGS